MKRMIIWPVVIFVLLVSWFWAGRVLTLGFDRLIPFPTRSLEVSPLTYHGSEFLVGGERLTITKLDNENADLQLVTDLQDRVVLSIGRNAFVLGPRTNPVNPSGPLIVDFVADLGDKVLLTSHESLLGWPNPFEMSWLGGSVPRWTPAGSRLPRIQFENIARTKIGGYASTIQSAPWWGHMDHPSNPKFCLQINSEEKAGLIWGDGGTIYAARGTEPGSLDQWFLDWQSF